MTPGKVASQAVHAALGAYRRALSAGKAQVVSDWQAEGEKTVLLNAENDEMMINLSALARDIGLVVHECRDAGKFEF